MRASQRELRERAECLSVRRIGNPGQGLDGEIGLASREPRSVLKPSGRFNYTGNSPEVLDAARLDRLAQARCVIGR